MFPTLQGIRVRVQFGSKFPPPASGQPLDTTTLLASPADLDEVSPARPAGSPGWVAYKNAP
jgi:hypothetical protein